jgi:hypothetical protein
MGVWKKGMIYGSQGWLVFFPSFFQKAGLSVRGLGAARLLFA